MRTSTWGSHGEGWLCRIPTQVGGSVLGDIALISTLPLDTLTPYISTNVRNWRSAPGSSVSRKCLPNIALGGEYTSSSSRRLSCVSGAMERREGARRDWIAREDLRVDLIRFEVVCFK